ncbi:30S ribosomal protein S9 [Rubricoccus marinus]|uniref:Small ribosomal subunit protein uS9 n=1 Tax=Rubricoccus marinus TaxID=716817 RepID=A0A259U2Q0_9BACT|nr:30S ribosomal protein S9 [Rubricoccus marinus]OZC04216.1 30S ribosomal protein S9 [Rubricoccus marinus]
MPTQYQAVGRRKTSVARVYLRPGSGNVIINKRPLSEYLPTEIRQRAATAALDLTELRGEFDVVVNAKGGGLTGQADAIQLGVARCLVEHNAELRKPLRDAGYLTRDPRMVERKKPGQPKARKKFQFSKR